VPRYKFENLCFTLLSSFSDNYISCTRLHSDLDVMPSSLHGDALNCHASIVVLKFYQKKIPHISIVSCDMHYIYVMIAFK